MNQFCFKRMDIKRLNDSILTFDQRVKGQFSKHISLAFAYSAFPEIKIYFSFGIIQNLFKYRLHRIDEKENTLYRHF